MRKIESRTHGGARREELAVYCMVFSLVHAMKVKAAVRQRVTPSRVSFIDTIRRLLIAAPGEDLP